MRGKPRPRGKKAPSTTAAGTDGRRRLVITVCLRERGGVVLPLERGGRRRRLDASSVMHSLRDLVAARGYDALVSVREGCAGGCARMGPNVDVRIYPTSPHDTKPET